MYNAADPARRRAAKRRHTSTKGAARWISVRRRLIKDRAETVLIEPKSPAVVLCERRDFGLTRVVIVRPYTRQFRFVHGAVVCLV